MPCRRAPRAAGSASATPGRATSWRRSAGSSRLGLQPRGELAPRQREADVGSLREVAAEAGEHLPRRRVLDLLRDDLPAEAMAEVDRAAHDGGVALVARHLP